jgi:Lhr-like helicase
MIEILHPNQPTTHKWLNPLIEQLKTHENRFNKPVDLIINQIIRGEYVVFNVNNEVQIVGFTYNNGNVRTFFIYFCVGRNVKDNLLEMLAYCKENLGHSEVEFMAQTEKHVRLYESILRRYKTRKSYNFNLTL